MMLVAVVLARAAAAQEAPLPTGGAATVQPGDRIALRILREPEMSDTFNVALDGEVVLPRLGVVRVADQTAGALQQSLRVALARYLRDPSIQVTVLRRVAVGGDVARPGIYLVDLTTAVRDAISLAGGITESGDPSKILIHRGGRVYRLAERDANAVASAELRSGDRIIVGRRSWAARNPNVAVGMVTGLVGFFIGIVQLLKG